MVNKDKSKISAVIGRNRKQILRIDGVVGVAEGLWYNRPCIKVFVIKKSPQVLRKIPKSLEGFPVRIEETGEFKALK